MARVNVNVVGGGGREVVTVIPRHVVGESWLCTPLPL